MQTINYPLLYFQLNDQAVLGLLVGTEYKVVQSDLKSVKQTLSNYLRQQYKKEGEYYHFGIEIPKMTIVNVPIRPTYRDKNSFHPSPDQIKVPVTAIHGLSGNGIHTCYLPLFNVRFHYYDKSQFRPLVVHFTNNHLNQKQPREIYRYLLYNTPQLEQISLRVNPGDDIPWNAFSFKREPKQLKRLTEQFPAKKTPTRKVVSFPEAAWEREEKVSEVIEKLSNLQANVLLVGESGVGKSAILQQAIRRITTQNKDKNGQMTFWRIMAQRITATAKYFGEWQGIVEELIEELQEVNGVLWVEDIVRLLQIGGSGAEDSVAAFMVSFLQQGKLQIVSEVTERTLENLRRLLPGFAEAFQVVHIAELSEEKTRSVLQQFADFASNSKLQVHIEEDSLQLAYQLLNRYYPYESFPGKGLKFLGQTVSAARLKQEQRVTTNDIIHNFVEQTGLPELFLRDDILLNTNELSSYFFNKIIGQTVAVNKLGSIVKIFKAGLNNPFKPIATLLFAGPTGVGKTASAQALADYFFGKGQRRAPLIRIDMSEYQHPSQLGRFIGMGNEVGQLVKEVRERPFSVMLLDEVEKAHVSIFDALLTVLDEGMLVDNFGRVTNFRNTIIIMTTNLGANQQRTPTFVDTTTSESRYSAAVASHFRPEFVNRIDDIVMFNALQQEDILQIARKELNDFKKREGLTKRGLKLHFSDALVKHLAKVGFDERYGARMLQRAVDEQVMRPLSNWLLDHLQVQNCTLYLDYEKTLVIRKS